MRRWRHDGSPASPYHVISLLGYIHYLLVAGEADVTMPSQYAFALSRCRVSAGGVVAQQTGMLTVRGASANCLGIVVEIQGSTPLHTTFSPQISCSK